MATATILHARYVGQGAYTKAVAALKPELDGRDKGKLLATATNTLKRLIQEGSGPAGSGLAKGREYLAALAEVRRRVYSSHTSRTTAVIWVAVIWVAFRHLWLR